MPTYYPNADMQKRHDLYFSLAESLPDLFAPSAHYPISMDRQKMIDFEQSTGKKLGVVFNNYPFYYVIADLIESQTPFAYARTIYPEAKNGTVIIPCLEQEGGEPLFGLLKVFRHTIRATTGGEFPRGFMSPGLTERENAIKELKEELGVHPRQVTDVVFLGKTNPDTGLVAGAASVYLVKLAGNRPAGSVGHEGIRSSQWLTLPKLLEKIKQGEVVDGFTTTAILLYLLHQGQ